MRKPIIAGNWKMNKTPSQAVELINALKPLVANAKCEIVICPPFICLPVAAEAIKGSNIILGAQNMHWENSGAFTGEISADMLLELGIKYVIIGHSERRQYFGETDETVSKRSKAALAKGLIPIICVGESLEQREIGITFHIIETQINTALEGMTSEQVASCVIAYEPIWAIGTGRTATSEQANEVIVFIREAIAKQFDDASAQKTRIQYGGSMNPKNASELMAQSDIDGGLIGGASLKPEDFAAVINF